MLDGDVALVELRYLVHVATLRLHSGPMASLGRHNRGPGRLQAIPAMIGSSGPYRDPVLAAFSSSHHQIVGKPLENSGSGSGWLKRSQRAMRELRSA